MQPLLVAALLVAVAHAAGMAYVVLGGFLGLRDPRWLLPHLAALGWIAVSWTMLAICPLTRLEKWLLATGGGTPYSGNYVDHYLAGTLYPTALDGLTRPFGGCLVLLSWVLVARHRRRERDRVQPGATSSPSQRARSAISA